uniref:GT23 domain-containing protein n=1 Tax=Branchiostoma floridae TaxID=7739 RepID=C3YNH0_BRAFL|eukprot:XP_002602264.1 hypothetical protein BRAFLDRAFT_76952 [Branchiostoma floridae]
MPGFRYFEPFFEFGKPVAVHHNSKYGGDTDVIACVIEPSLNLCEGTGFGALVLQTIDDITTCLVYLTRPGASGDLLDFRFADLERKVTQYVQPITAEIRALVNHVISGYVKPVARIENNVNAFYALHMADTVNIGVHMRLKRDHIEEMNEIGQKAPDVQDFVLAVQRFITANVATAEKAGKEIRIFLACDLDEGLAVFKAELRDYKVLNIEAMRGDEFIYRRKEKVSSRSLGEEVLTDILLLSKCGYLIHDESSVAAVAYYFNPNVKSYFVSGDATDHRRLNAGPRFDSEELLRQAVARETSNIQDLSDGEVSRWGSYLRKWEFLWVLIYSPSDADVLLGGAKCFYKNRKRSKCRAEFDRLHFTNKSNLTRKT